MKKIICMVVICVLVLGVAAAGFAAGETFEIPDLHMTVTIPGAEGLMTAVTGVEANDMVEEWVEELGVDVDYFMDYLENNMIYFNAIDPNGSFEYSISAWQDNASEYVYDLDTLSQADMEEVMKEATGINSSGELDQDVLDDMVSNGVQIFDDANINIDSLEKIGDTTYMVGSVDGTSGEIDLWQQLYITVKNGQFIYIRMISYDGPVTDEQKSTLKEIVQSASYENIPSTGATYAQDKAKADGMRNIMVGVIIAVVVIIAIVLVVTLRKNTRKKAQAVSNPQFGAQGQYYPPQNMGQGGAPQAPPQGQIPQQPQGNIPPAAPQPPSEAHQAGAPQQEKQEPEPGNDENESGPTA